MPNQEPTQRKPHELDTLVVKNIDINCNVIDTTDYYPHKEYFQVKYSGKSHRIAPGATKRMPRFLAEHFAKHLANHILMAREEKEKVVGLLQSSVERPKVIKEIILGVDTWFLGDDQTDEVVETSEPVTQEDRPIDLGVVNNPLIGVLKDITTTSTPTVVVQPQSVNETSIWDESKPKPDQSKLLEECKKLGIDVTGNETADELAELIKKF